MKTNLLLSFAALLLPVFALAAPVVTNVTAKQRYPWNGKVDISYTVSGEVSENWLPFAFLAVTATDGDTGAFYSASSLSGDGSVDEGTHTVVWDAAADLGEVRFTNMVVSVNVRLKGQLWENGPLWAEKNIGAENPWDYGLYFWWGDTVGYKRENNAWVASDGSSEKSFSFWNAPTIRKDTATLESEGWIVTKDGTNVLAPEHDAALTHWGGSWRMPTYQEFSDLNSNCDWTWTTQNDVNGFVVRGRGDFAEASIFLPAAGHGNMTSLSWTGSLGRSWASVPNASSSNSSWGCQFSSDGHLLNDLGRDFGLVVRPVLEVTE